MKRRATAEEKAHMERISKLPCLACGSYPVEVHHCRINTGMGLRPSHYDTIPLCSSCHRGTFSIHNCKKQFEAKYGTQQEMLEKVKRLLTYGDV